MRFAGSHDLKVLIQSSFEECEEKYGSHWYNMHRVDIHSQLKGLAEGAEDRGRPVKIHLASEVVRVDFDETVLELASGAKHKKDLIILADGSHCKFLEELNGRPVPMVSSGMTVFRSLIPFEKIMTNPDLAALWDGQPPGFFLVMDFATQYLTVTYPCRGNTLLNLVFLKPSTESEKDAHGDDWHHPSSKEEIKDWMEGTAHHQTWLNLIDLADNVKKFQVMTHESLHRLYKGAVVAVGDAAHPMLPTHAEGGSMAIEDAAALGIIFSSHTQPDEIGRRLQIYQEVRFARSMITQMMSNNRVNSMSHAGQEEQAQKWGYDGKLPEDNARYFKQDFRDFFYTYRVEDEAKDALKAHGMT